MLVPCALGAITYELYESFKAILFAKQISIRHFNFVPKKRHPIEFQSKPHKIKLFAVLTKLVSVKPEFVLSMGRLTEDMLPTIELLLKKDSKKIDKLEFKMLESMLTFITECENSYQKMEGIDQTRF